jgi:hypothetical protein
MGRSKAFGKGSATNQSPRNGPLRAAADICDSLPKKQAWRDQPRDDTAAEFLDDKVLDASVEAKGVRFTILNPRSRARGGTDQLT